MKGEYRARLLQKRDTSSNWTKNDPVILNGEIILVDTDSGELRAKIGDGVKKYTQLPFSDEVLRNLINNKVFHTTGGTVTGETTFIKDVEFGNTVHETVQLKTYNSNTYEKELITLFSDHNGTTPVVNFISDNSDGVVIPVNVGDPVSPNSATNKRYVDTAIESLQTLPYGGSKEWLENNGDTTKLYQIDGYVWGYIESNGWTKSNTQFLVVSNESKMINEGGTEYLLRSGNNGTVYEYTAASGDAGIPVYDELPETANEGDIVAVGGKKYQASLSTKVVPNYTNLAEPNIENTSDWNLWINNARMGSDGKYRSDTRSVTNYIPCAMGDTIRIKGIASLSGTVAGAGAIYDANKTFLGIYYPGSDTGGNKPTYADETATFIAGRYNSTTYSNTAYQRMTVEPIGSVSDVIITVNEEITTKTVETVTWTEIGEYIPPVEAGWNATDRTHTIIDSISEEATNGDSAVYSGDGYIYTYINGADWMAVSKYTKPTIEFDDALSTTSDNAVKNRTVAEAMNVLAAKARTNADNILNLQNEVEMLGSGSGSSSSEVVIPSYWESAVLNKTETVKALQRTGGRNCISFAWASDTHIPDCDNGRTNNLGKVMAKMLDNCEIPFAIITGDVGTRASYSTEEAFVNSHVQLPIHLAPLWGTERLLMAMGNHDGCYGDSTGYYRKQFTPERMWQLYFRGQALDFRRVFSDDGQYYYIDNIPQKTRFIVLNSHFGGEYAEDEKGWAVNNRFGTSCFGQAQLDWLATNALDMPEDYSAILFAHVPPNITYTCDKAQMMGIVNAYNNRTSFSGSYTTGVDGWSNSSVSVNFTTAKGEVIAMFAGHIHWDKVDTETMSCPIITIIAGGASVNEGYVATGETIPTRTAGTDTETSFDVVTINKATRTIYCTRIGGGSDREIHY